MVTISTGAVETVAGQGGSDLVDGVGPNAKFMQLQDIKVTADGRHAYIADATINWVRIGYGTGNVNAVRKLDLTTYAVTTVTPASWRIWKGRASSFMQLKDVAVTKDGSTVYFTDCSEGRIMKHNVADNSVSAFCGGAGRCSGHACHSDRYTKTRNCATDRIFNFVQGLVLSPDNSVLYTSDSRSLLVYKITIATGVAEPLVGDNSRAFTGDNAKSVVDGQVNLTVDR